MPQRMPRADIRAKCKIPATESDGTGIARGLHLACQRRWCVDGLGITLDLVERYATLIKEYAAGRCGLGKRGKDAHAGWGRSDDLREHSQAMGLFREPFMIREDEHSGARMPPPPFARRVRSLHRSRWALIPAAIGIVAALLTWAFELLTVQGADWASPLVIALALYVVCVSAMSVLRYPPKTQKLWAKFRGERRRWKKAWPVLLGASSPRPALEMTIQMARFDADAGEEGAFAYKRLVFSSLYGVDCSDAELWLRQLAAVVREDIIYLWPPSGRVVVLDHATPDFRHWVASREAAWIELRYSGGIRVDAETAYLDPTLSEAAAEFLFHRRLSLALQSLGVGRIAANSAYSILSDPNQDLAPVYIRYAVTLTGTSTYQKIVERANDLSQRLHVGWLRFEQPSATSELVLHCCAVHPDRTRFSAHLDRKMCREVQRLDWEHWMRSAGLVGTDNKAPALKARRSPNHDIGMPEPDAELEMEFALPIGLTVDDVRHCAARLRATSGFRSISVTEHPDDPARAIVLASQAQTA